MKTINNVLNAAKNKKYGNHYVKIDGCIRSCIYNYTTICVVNDATKTFIISNGGLDIKSINRAIKSYRTVLIAKGYTEHVSDCVIA